MPEVFDLARYAEIGFAAMKAAVIHGTFALVFVAAFVAAFRKSLSHAFAHGAFLLVPAKAVIAAIFAGMSLNLTLAVPVPASWGEARFEPGDAVRFETQAITRESVETMFPGEIPPSMAIVSESPPIVATDHAGESPSVELPIAGSRSGDSKSETAVPPVSDSKSAFTPLLGILFVWLSGIYILTFRWCLVTIRFTRRVRTTSAPSQAATIRLVESLASEIRLRRMPSVVSTTAVASPAVFGLIRPTLLIPAGFETAFDEAEMRWAIAHELAHLKRRDLWAVAFERAVGLAGFFHPAFWLARRATANFRELACDDMAGNVTGLPPRMCAETFLKILVWADRQPAHAPDSPLVLGMNPRYPAIRRRIENMTDQANSKRPARLGRMSGLLLALLAMTLSLPVVPKLVAMGPGIPAKVEGESVIRIDQENPIEQIESAEKSMRLRLIDQATGKPVKDAQVIYVIDESPKVTVRTDESGIAMLPFDAGKMRSLRYRTSLDGYVDTIESWSRGRTIDFPPPDEIERKIKRSVAIGGKIVDMQGQPIEGVNVTVIHSVKSIDRNGDSNLKNMAIEARTDASGTFKIDRFDPDAIGAHVYVSHPRFVRAEKEVPQVREPDLLPDLLARRYVLKMQPGKSVRGTVLGPDGQPVEGATIWNDDGTQYFEKIDARSGEDGKFKAGNFGELVRGGFRMAVHKPGVGWAIERVIEAEIDKPLTFRLAPPRRLVVTVRDADGKPLVGARVLNSFLTDDMWKDPARLTGPDGRYFAQDLPAAELQISAHLDGFESRHLRVDTISNESVDIVLKPTYAIEGSVTDAVTGQPVDRYRVEQLLDSKSFPQTYRLDSEKSGNRFRILRTMNFADESKNESFRLRIIAEGYESFDTDSIPAHSRQAPLKIALKPLGPEWYVSGRVLRPDGTPAAGAAVGYFSSPGVDELRYLPALRNGKVVGMQFARMGQDGMTPWTLIRTGADGTFRFPAHFASMGWVVSHDSGILRSRGLEPRPASSVELKLEPRSRVEGQLFVDGEPAAETLVRIDYPFAESREPFFPIPGVNQDQPIRTDAEGRFRFENVLPGEIRLSYGDPGTPIQSNRFAGTFETKAGETLRIVTRKSQFHFEEIAFAPDGKEIARSDFGSDRPGFRIYGKITDAETGKPVLGTWSYAFSGYDLVKDVWVAPTNSMSGRFETQAITPLPPDVKPESVNPWLIVVSDGYEPYVSPERIRNEGKAVRRDVKLKPIDKSKWNVYKGRVERADGSRANGVRVDFTVGDPGIKIGDVSFRWAMWSNVIFRTNDDGTFEFAFPRTLDRLVFTDGEIVAVVKAAEFASGENRVAKLGEFARIEGRLTRGGKPLEKLGIGLDQGLIPSSTSLIDPQREIRPDGTFTISKVMPGPVTILFNDAKDLSKVTRLRTVQIECKPGETARVEVDVDATAHPEQKSQSSAISKPVVPDSKPGEPEKTANSKPGETLKSSEPAKASDSKNPAAPPKPEFPAPSGKFITGKVLKPDGSPAAGAEVGFFTTTDDRNERFLPRLSRQGLIEAIEHRSIVRGQWNNSEREPIRTDAEGRFQLPVWAEKFGWCVTHDAGALKSTKLVEMAEGDTELKLEPWGRIEGTLLLDERPMSSATVYYQPNLDIGKNRFGNPMPTGIRANHPGMFVIERAMPGPYWFAFPNPASQRESIQYDDHEMNVPAGGTLKFDVNLTMFGWEERMKDDTGKIVDRKTYGAMRPGFRVYGQVIDADTGVPVEPKEALLVNGQKNETLDILADERPGSVFSLNFLMTGKGPKILGEVDPYLVVIAPGYEPYVSAERIKKGDSPVHHDVRLKKLPAEKTLTIEGQVLDPDGKTPYMAFYRNNVPGETVQVGESTFAWKFATENPPFSIDKGRFRFTVRNAPGKLVFSNQVGFAQVEASDFAKLPGGVVRLQPWGKVRLRVLRNGKADPDFRFTNDHREGWKLSFVPSGSWYPADDGTFLLDRLPPMPIELYLTWRTSSGPSFVLKPVTIEAKPGETTVVDVVVTDDELKVAEAILKARQAGN